VKKKKKNIGKFYYFYPQTVAFVGYENNIMPAAWHTPISAQPPLFGVLISPKRHTYTLLCQKKGFTVNFLDFAGAKVSADTGSSSGKEIDKLTTYDLAHEKGVHINGPILDQSYAAYECEHFAVHELGDHFLFVGKIVLIHYEENCLEKAECVNATMIKPLLYFGKDRYITINPQTLTIKPRR